MKTLFLYLVLPLLLTVAVHAQVEPDLARGRKIFESQCALCHGQNGGGGRGPNLNRSILKHALDDDALRKLIVDGVPPEMPGAWQLNPREVVSVAAYVRSLGRVAPEVLPGSAAHGESVYQRGGCSGCHMLDGQGAGFGPDLTGIGTRRSGTFLKQTLLNPASSIPEDFEYLALKPVQGQAVRGIRVNEDSFTIQLKDLSGRFYSFRKSDLQQLERLEHQTPMPSYDKRLTSAELDDLVAYLAGMRGRQ